MPNDRPDLPLCADCVALIGGACAGPDMDWRPARAGEPCGASDCDGLRWLTATEIRLLEFPLTPVPTSNRCGHSACSQHFIDTGSTECLHETEGD